MTIYSTTAALILKKLRARTPLIHTITNYVAMNVTANALLALGASPVMAHAKEEVRDIASIADAVVLNIGTLSPRNIDSMIIAGKTASQLKKPVVLDPVGAGAASFRTAAGKRILNEAGVSIVRGNASEILGLFNGEATIRGVDAAHDVTDAAAAAKQLALQSNGVAAVTGPVDKVTDGRRTLTISGGHPLMAKVTAIGCMASAIAGAFAAVETDALAATASALACFGLAGEMAAQKAEGPGSFMMHLIDALYTMTPENLEAGATITEV